MDFKIISFPTEPVSDTGSVLSYLRLSSDHTDEVKPLILEAEDYISNYIGQFIGEYEALITFDLIDLFLKNTRREFSFSDLHDFPISNDLIDKRREFLASCCSLKPFTVKISPVTEISAIKYYSIDDTEMTIDPINYNVDTDGLYPIVNFKEGFQISFQSLRSQRTFKMNVKAGFNSMTLPSSIKLALKQLIALIYENRGEPEFSLKDRAQAIFDLCSSHRIREV